MLVYLELKIDSSFYVAIVNMCVVECLYTAMFLHYNSHGIVNHIEPLFALLPIPIITLLCVLACAVRQCYVVRFMNIVYVIVLRSYS